MIGVTARSAASASRQQPALFLLHLSCPGSTTLQATASCCSSVLALHSLLASYIRPPPYRGLPPPASRPPPSVTTPSSSSSLSRSRLLQPLARKGNRICSRPSRLGFAAAAWSTSRAQSGASRPSGAQVSSAGVRFLLFLFLQLWLKLACLSSQLALFPVFSQCARVSSLGRLPRSSCCSCSCWPQIRQFLGCAAPYLTAPGLDQLILISSPLPPLQTLVLYSCFLD